MKNHSYREDNILGFLVKNDKRDDVWKQMYKGYREPFVRFFEKHYQLEVKVIRRIYEDAFVDFYFELVDGPIRFPLSSPMIYFLLQKGFEHMKAKSIVENNRPKAFKELLPTAGKYYESDILLLLLKESYEPAVEKVFAAFQPPTVKMINSIYRTSTEDPIEVYGEAVSILVQNIKEEKVKPPLKSKLFTYFFKIVLNLFRVLVRSGSRTTLVEDTFALDNLLNAPTEQKETYLDYIVEEKQKLTHLGHHSLEDLVADLLGRMGEKCSRILKMRFLEELQYKEIAERVQKTEGNARKVVFDCLKRMRRMIDA